MFKAKKSKTPKINSDLDTQQWDEIQRANSL